MTPDTSRYRPDLRTPATRHTEVWLAAALALVVAASLALVHAWSASAAPGDTDTTYNPTAGCRVTDTRDPDHIGPRSTPLGPNETMEVTIHGNNGECTGDLAIPSDATGVAANVTAVGATTASNLRIFPADLTNVPLLSNLNVTAGAPPTPNKVDVQLSPDGKIKVYNANGNVDVVIDIVGFYTPTSLRELAESGGSAGPAGPQGPAGPAGPAGIVEMHHGVGPEERFGGSTPADLIPWASRVVMQTPNGNEAAAHKQLQGPASIAGVPYALTSVRYCVVDFQPGAFVTRVQVRASTDLDSAVLNLDQTDRPSPGCYELEVNDTQARDGYMFTATVDGNSVNDSVTFISISSTWTPLS